jgi:hypothetical protein
VGSSNSDVAVREGRNLVIPSDEDYAMMSYDELAAMEGFRVSGLSLLSKDTLLGVPHIITKVTYWRVLEGRIGHVSVEATLASADAMARAIRRGWVPGISNVDDMVLDPNERVVYNDGGTGIRRQLTALFHAKKAVDVGREDVADDSRYDTPWPEWVSFLDARVQSREVGEVPVVYRIPDGDGYRPLILHVDRGLNVSKYANEYTDDGETYYLQ